MLEISEQTIVQWFARFRNVCSDKLVRESYKIAGPGKVVEIDEHVIVHRKHEKGRMVSERWVFGRACAETDEGFLVFVENRSADVLLPLLMEHVESDSIVFTDK